MLPSHLPLYTDHKMHIVYPIYTPFQKKNICWDFKIVQFMCSTAKLSIIWNDNGLKQLEQCKNVTEVIFNV